MSTGRLGWGTDVLGVDNLRAGVFPLVDIAGPRTRSLRYTYKRTYSAHTHLGLLTPDPETKELVLTGVHPGVDPERVKQETGWPLRVTEPLATTDPPTDAELAALRVLEARTRGGERTAMKPCVQGGV